MLKIIQLISFLGLAVIFGGTAAHAQSSLTTTFEADVPFEFDIAKRSFSPGKYLIRLSGGARGPKLLELRDDRREVLFRGFLGMTAERNETGQLRFERESGRTVLSSIVTDHAGYIVPVSKQTKLIASSKRTRNSKDND